MDWLSLVGLGPLLAFLETARGAHAPHPDGVDPADILGCHIQATCQSRVSGVLRDLGAKTVGHREPAAPQVCPENEAGKDGEEDPPGTMDHHRDDETHDRRGEFDDKERAMHSTS